MKRIIAFMLISFFCFALFGCAGGGKDTDTTEAPGDNSHKITPEPEVTAAPTDGIIPTPFPIGGSNPIGGIVFDRSPFEAYGELEFVSESADESKTHFLNSYSSDSGMLTVITYEKVCDMNPAQEDEPAYAIRCAAEAAEMTGSYMSASDMLFEDAMPPASHPDAYCIIVTFGSGTAEDAVQWRIMVMLSDGFSYALALGFGANTSIQDAEGFADKVFSSFDVAYPQF